MNTTPQNTQLDSELEAVVVRHLQEIKAGHDSKLIAALKTLIADRENKARLDELERLPKSEIGKLANHSIKVDLRVEDRIKEIRSAINS